MTQPSITNPITSSKQLTYDGFLGYAKTHVAILTGVLESVVPFVPVDSTTAKWLHIVIAVLGALGVYLVPNKIKPTPPAPVEPDPNAPAAPMGGELQFGQQAPDAGRHEAPQI